MDTFNYKDYLKNNPLLSNTKPSLLTEGVVKNLQSKLSDFGSESEIDQYLKSLSKSGDTFSDIEDYVEDFKNYVADKSLEETDEPRMKMTEKEIKAKIRETIKSTLQETGEEISEEEGIESLEDELYSQLDEAEEDEEDEVNVEDEDEEVDVEDDEIGGGDADAIDTSAGLSQDEQDIQNALKVAYDNAKAVGDEKLADQIGNTITMFTRTRVVNR